MSDRDHTLFLLDGMALAYRAHFALATNPIRTSTGRVTSGIYGFTNTLLDLLNRFNPTHLAVVFDTEAPTARHKEFEAYKAQREAMPEELSQALPDIKRIIRAFNFPVIELDGYEADDLIATLARVAEPAGFTTYMVTPDKDFGQLVTEHILQYRPSRMGDNPETLGVKEILAKWGIEKTDQVRDILGFSGDTSDNIPGVPGVGPKTAQKLVAQYGTLENALDHASEQKGKLGESLVKFREQALLSKRLVTIDTNAPIAFEPEKLLIGPRNDEELRALFTEFEFNTLGRRLFGEDFKAAAQGTAAQGRLAQGGSAQNQLTAKKPAFAPSPTSTALPLPPSPVGPPKTIEDTKPDYQVVPKLPADYAKETTLAVAFDLDPKNELCGIAFAHKSGEARYVAGSGAEAFAKTKLILGHDLKRGLRAWFRSSPNPNNPVNPVQKEFPPLFDTALAHSLVYPDLKHTLEYVAESMLGYTPLPAEIASGQQDFLASLESDNASELAARRAMERADLAFQLHASLEPKLKESAQERVFYEIESPLLPVLAEMENAGIRLDPVALDEVGQKLRAEQARLEASIYVHALGPFNIGSPKQLGEVLFGKLALAKDAKKTKTGQYATDEATLTALAPLHPIVDEILQHREASKLLSTYISALPAAVAADGRIHTTFNQLATTTGRLNSQDPNLQNIPIRTAAGREIRRAFVPRDDEHRLLSADYSQIELRILAALTQDAGLLESITSGEDIHRATAAKVFGLPLDQVTKEQRNQAKMVNYGISYGISAFGLSQRLGIPRGEAKLLIDGYFAQYPGIRQYMTETVERARVTGYVETVTGRRRYLPDLRSANQSVRAGAERNAINMPIQGSSADLLKLAMVKIAKIAREEKWRTTLLLTVHDELVFDLYQPEEKRVVEAVHDAMKNALPELKVPILVETGIGAHWLEAH